MALGIARNVLRAVVVVLIALAWAEKMAASWKTRSRKIGRTSIRALEAQKPGDSHVSVSLSPRPDCSGQAAVRNVQNRSEGDTES